MAGERSNKRSKRDKKKVKPKKKASQGRPKEEKAAGGVQKFGPAGGGLEKVPSNAPTMAIAPSDYEHIFHEGPAGAQQPALEETPPAAAQPAKTATLPLPGPSSNSRRRLEAAQEVGQQQRPESPLASPPTPARARQPYAGEVQVTPDGYNLLGQPPAESPGGRRVALPAHIVRASNQFSRAALARVARFLASRAEPPTFR